MSDPQRLHHALGRAPGNKAKSLPPTLLQPNEVEALIAACTQTRYAARNQTLIALLYRTGAMIGEVLSLRLPDVDMASNTLRLGGELKLDARMLGIDEPLGQALSEFLEHRQTLALPGDWLFYNTSSHYDADQGAQAMSYGAVQNLLNAVTQLAGLGSRRVHAQAFRHSFAAELIGEGWPLPYIQRQLGITTFRNMDTLLNNLDLPLPADEEVMAVIRTRVWDHS